MSELKETRVRQIRKLIQKHGSQEALALEINNGLGKNDKPIAPSQFSGAINGTRPFGDKICRKIESALGLPNYWLEGQEGLPDTKIKIQSNTSQISSQKLSGAIRLIKRQYGEDMLDMEIDELSEKIANEYNSLPD